jgi:hypothetical protein
MSRQANPATRTLDEPADQVALAAMRIAVDATLMPRGGRSCPGTPPGFRVHRHRHDFAGNQLLGATATSP